MDNRTQSISKDVPDQGISSRERKLIDAATSVRDTLAEDDEYDFEHYLADLNRALLAYGVLPKWQNEHQRHRWEIHTDGS